MKRIFAFLLCAAMLLTFAACGSSGNTENLPPETTEEMNAVENHPTPAFEGQLTWDAINAIPVKREDMTVQEMRELCVQFMRLSKTAMWIPNDLLQFEKTTNKPDEMQTGTIYGGLPYIGKGGCGNIYRLMDYIDQETGMVDMGDFKSYPALFGSHCSSCTYWAWGRVINSVGHNFTATINHNNGFLRIGPYTYDDNQPKFTDYYTTIMICEENGLDIMCQSYAQLHLADGLVQYVPGGGHVIMATSEPHVEMIGEQIDPVNSYVLISEQGQGWEEYTNEGGITAQIKNSVDKKMSFMDLFEKHYLPFSYAEFLGTDKVDATECTVNLSGDSVDAMQLFNAKVTANFGISDIYVSLKNQDGKEVFRQVTRATNAGEMTLNINRNGTNTFCWGDYDKLSGEYSVEVTVQLSTGERPVVYTGKVAI